MIRRGLKVALVALALPVGAMERIDGLAAVVGDQAITLGELRQAWRMLGSPPDLPPSVVLDRKITDTMIDREIAKLGIQVTDAEIERAIDDIRTGQEVTREQLESQLKLAGTNWEEYRKSIADQLKQVKVVNQRIRVNVAVSEAELRELYQRRVARMSGRGVADVRIVVLPFQDEAESAQARALAAQLHAEVERGADFGKLATRYSRGPGASDGGWVKGVRQGELQKALDQAIFSLPLGGLSPPTEGLGAWFLVKLERLDKEAPAPYEAMRAELSDEAYREKFTDLFQVWVDELRSRTNVDIRIEDGTDWNSL